MRPRFPTTPAVFLLALSGSLAAQGVTLPPGFDSTEAAHYAYDIGGYAETRAQLCTSLLKGGVTVMNGLDLRQDGTVFGSSTGVARSWANVTLQISDGDYANLSTTFANNATSTPTKVFSGSVNWGPLTTKAPTQPAAWGTDGRTFGFSAAHISRGTNDMLLDFSFSGGQLSNSGAWGTTRKTYYLDGQTYEIFSSATAYLFGNYPCISPRSTYTFPDQHVLWNYTYGKSNGSIYDNQILYNTAHQYSAANTNHIGAVGATGVTTAAAGVPLGGCQPLMLTPLIFYPFTTDSTGYWSSPSATVAFQSNYVGLEIWAQAAHDVQGTIHLCRVSRTQILPQPPAPKDYKMVFRNNLTTPTGTITQVRMPVFLVR